MKGKESQGREGERPGGWEPRAGELCPGAKSCWGVVSPGDRRGHRGCPGILEQMYDLVTGCADGFRGHCESATLCNDGNVLYLCCLVW